MRYLDETLFLLPGERIIWQGQPKPGIWFERADAFAIPLSVLWLVLTTGIFGLMLTGPSTLKIDPVGYAMMPVFWAAGLYFVFGRFLVARWVRSKTRYHLTNRRAIVRSGLIGRREQAVNLAATSETRISMARDGFGTIEFGQSSPFSRMMPRSWAFGQSGMLSPTFERIANAQEVYRMIITAQVGG